MWRVETNNFDNHDFIRNDTNEHAYHAQNHILAYVFKDILWVMNTSSTTVYDKKIIVEQYKGECFVLNSETPMYTSDSKNKKVAPFTCTQVLKK